MKKLIAYITVLGILPALLLVGCSLDTPSDPTGTVNDPGPADASTPYVAIGNSLTAGFMDSGLMKAGQANSYPMIVANQMGLGDSFTQPWIDAPGIGTTNVGAGNVSGVLHFNGSTVLPLGITPLAEVSKLLLAVSQPTQYHNLGVPTAFSHDLLNAYSAASSHTATLPAPFVPNSYFEFINRTGDIVNLFGNVSIPAAPPAPAYESGSQFYQTIAKGPALVTAWIGGNDFLFGAASGDPQGPANAFITDPAVFAANYGAFLGSLMGGLQGRNGFPTPVITATLPLVRNIAYFLDRATFEAVFGPLQLSYEEADAEYILFVNFISSDLPTTPGGTLPANMTLSPAEVTYLDTGVIGPYNAAIVGTMAQLLGVPGATIDQLPIVDFNILMDDLRAENPDAARHFLLLRIMYGGVDTIAETAARTYFSLDGVHPNNKGYAFVANGFLGKINEVTGSSWATVPVDAFVWDPTYGTTPVPAALAPGEYPKISPEAVEAMRMSF